MIAVAYSPHAARSLLRGGAADDEIRLGRTIAVDQPNTGALLKGEVEIGRHAGPQAASNAVTAFLRRWRPRHQDRHHGAKHVSRRCVMLDEALPEPRCGKAQFGHERRARQ